MTNEGLKDFIKECDTHIENLDARMVEIVDRAFCRRFFRCLFFARLRVKRLDRLQNFLYNIRSSAQNIQHARITTEPFDWLDDI